MLVGKESFVGFLFTLSAVNEFSGGTGVSAFLEGSKFRRGRG